MAKDSKSSEDSLIKIHATEIPHVKKDGGKFLVKKGDLVPETAKDNVSDGQSSLYVDNILGMDDIEKFSKRKNVKKTAVENFLMSVYRNEVSFHEAVWNLNRDTISYSWNNATYNAILDGLKKLYNVHSDGRSVLKAQQDAQCKFCEQEMLKANGCTRSHISINGKKYVRIVFGKEEGMDDPECADIQHCHDCGAKRGGIHHFGCDVERCPVCNHQLISCNDTINGLFYSDSETGKVKLMKIPHALLTLKGVFGKRDASDVITKFEMRVFQSAEDEQNRLEDLGVKIPPFLTEEEVQFLKGKIDPSHRLDPENSQIGKQIEAKLIGLYTQLPLFSPKEIDLARKIARDDTGEIIGENTLYAIYLRLKYTWVSWLRDGIWKRKVYTDREKYEKAVSLEAINRNYYRSEFEAKFQLSFDLMMARLKESQSKKYTIMQFRREIDKLIRETAKEEEWMKRTTPTSWSEKSPETNDASSLSYLIDRKIKNIEKLITELENNKIKVPKELLEEYLKLKQANPMEILPMGSLPKLSNQITQANVLLRQLQNMALVESTDANQVNMKQVLIAILKINGKTLEDVKKEWFVKIKRGSGFMDLNIDYLGKECGLDKYAIAHNYMQNGDVMKDPDMMFYDEGGDDFLASSFEQDNPPLAEFSVECEKGQLHKNLKMQKEHQVFSHQWARNLIDQGILNTQPENIKFGGSNKEFGDNDEVEIDLVFNEKQKKKITEEAFAEKGNFYFFEGKLKKSTKTSKNRKK